MKAIKLIVVGLAVLLCAGSALAGGFSPTKCGRANDECRMLAYQACAEQFKTCNPTGGPNGTPTCTVNPTTPQFKECEVSYKANCVASRGC